MHFSYKNSPYTILQADERPIFQLGIRTFVQRLPHFRMVEGADQLANGDRAIVLIHRLKPDVVLLSTKIPGSDGFEITKHIRTEGLAIKVILFSDEWSHQLYESC